MSTVPLVYRNGTSTTAVAAAQTPAVRHLAVLIATPAASLLELDVLASLSGEYRVQLFAEPFNLFDLRASQVEVALLCGSAGVHRLSAEAFVIRKQWPLARIIVLGRPPDAFADHLYDDSIAKGCSHDRLMAIFGARAIDVWNDRVRRSNLPETPAESDPTKADPSDLKQISPPDLRDLPADERRTLLRSGERRSEFARCSDSAPRA